MRDTPCHLGVNEQQQQQQDEQVQEDTGVVQGKGPEDNSRAASRARTHDTNMEHDFPAGGFHTGFPPPTSDAYSVVPACECSYPRV
jgi:hypothetical protein